MLRKRCSTVGRPSKGRGTRVIMKSCRVCGAERPWTTEYFVHAPRCRDGLYAWCKPGNGLLSGASDCHQQLSTNNTTADPVHGSAATSIAAAGMPPEPHERDTVIAVRPRPLGSRADRMAPYKVIRRRWPARTVCGALSERDAPLRQAEGSGLSHSVTDRTRTAASQPAWAVQGRRRLEQRVEESQRGERAADRSAEPGACCRAGLRSSRGLAHAPDGRRLSAPTQGLRPHCPALQGAADAGDAASARGDLAEARRPFLGATRRVGAMFSRVAVLIP